MRRPIEDHRNPTWRVHDHATDFDLLDVWRFPIRLEADVPLATVLDFLTEVNSELRTGNGMAAQLFRLRGWLGRVFGWDGNASYPESVSVVDRGAAETASGIESETPSYLGFEPVYSTQDEMLFELENATVHALMHLGRVELEEGRSAGEWAPQMGVYVKRRGLLGRLYMAAITPFRHLIVYPTMMRAAARAWPGFAARKGLALLPTLLLFAGLLAAFMTPGAASHAEDVYSPGGWATLHRGPANRKLVPGAPLADEYRVWTALEGAAVLTAPTMSPDGRTLYVTTGRAKGHANLHAVGLDGELRWRAPAWSAADDTGKEGGPGVDPCAILSSPIVDREGDIYIGDCNQLFAFHADGQLKWVVPLPPIAPGEWEVSPDLPVNAFTTAIFTREGHVLGVTNFGDVVVVDRATGRSLAAPMRLPGLLPPESMTVPMPDSIFGDGLVDPAIRQWAWQLLFGGRMRSTNTPAVDLESGRVFVAATSVTEGKGALYALDLRVVEVGGDIDGVGDGSDAEGDVGKADHAVAIEIAWTTDMGPGSGSSPALSPSKEVVYVSDELGVFYAIAAETGEIEWQLQTKSTSAAAAVGANGDVYSLQAFGPALVAMTEGGRIRWQSDLAALAAAALPSSWLLGDPVAIGNGNPTVVGDVVLLPVAYGYETTLGRRIPWVVQSSLVAIDTKTGKGLRDVVRLADDSTGITAVLPDGTIVNSLGTAITSGLAPLSGIASWLLPGDLRLLPATGGIQVSRPIFERLSP